MKIILSLLLAFSVIGFSAIADSLDEARAKNTISELPTGFVKANNPAARSLAEEVNKKRRLHYEKIAKETGTTVDVVGSKAALKIEENLKKAKNK